MSRPASALAVTLGSFAVTLGSSAGTLTAQEDYRAADLDRPILVEDAQPAKFREWEMELGARGTIAEAESSLLMIAEIKTGLFRNGQAGVEVEAGFEDAPGGRASTAGLEAVHGHLFYNLNRETRGWPALSVRAELGSPGAGSLGAEDWSAGLKGIATRSLGRLRLHANGGYTFAAAADGGDYWRAGVAFDYPIGLFSKAILGDAYAEIPVSEGRTRVWAELGTRWQITNRSVLDFGIASRIDEWEEGNANVELVIGVSRVFGLPGLVRVPRYPNPSIR